MIFFIPLKPDFRRHFEDDRLHFSNCYKIPDFCKRFEDHRLHFSKHYKKPDFCKHFEDDRLLLCQKRFVGFKKEPQPMKKKEK